MAVYIFLTPIVLVTCIKNIPHIDRKHNAERRFCVKPFSGGRGEDEDDWKGHLEHNILQVTVN